MFMTSEHHADLFARLGVKAFNCPAQNPDINTTEHLSDE